MENKLQHITPNQFVKTLTIIHLALVVGVVIFTCVTLFLNKDAMNFEFSGEDSFLLIYPVIAIGGVSMSQLLFKKMLAVAKQKTDLIAMLGQYQTASLIKYVLIEGPAMIGTVFFLLTNNAAFIAIAGLLIAFLVLQRPTKTKIESDLALRGELRNQFQRYDEVIE
ncbi:hypothetical protein [Kordia sp.]|uniref:hypothetical protein n=1 Tax=Kordia sp. TaxID=1965332 RepID=UPI003B599C6E